MRIFSCKNGSQTERRRQTTRHPSLCILISLIFYNNDPRSDILFEEPQSNDNVPVCSHNNATNTPHDSPRVQKKYFFGGAPFPDKKTFGFGNKIAPQGRPNFWIFPQQGGFYGKSRDFRKRELLWKIGWVLVTPVYNRCLMLGEVYKTKRDHIKHNSTDQPESRGAGLP